MSLLKIVVLAIIQGLAELLPVSSSAHVIVAEKLMGLDVTSPQMTLLLVMLHTGTMFAVIVYFWRSWKESYFSSMAAFRQIAVRIIYATILTAIVYEVLKKILEKTVLHNVAHAHIEDMFGRLNWIAPALFAAGVLILIAGLLRRKEDERNSSTERPRELTMGQAAWIGLVQGICVPFRGFSRSGATISTGMLAGVTKQQSEVFSFALVVVLTPAAIAKEVLRAVHAQHAQALATGTSAGLHVSGLFLPSLLGMIFSFLAGLVALKWLSGWLENGRWYLFGIYCLLASVAVYGFYLHGF
ncbi:MULTISPECIES: undecaprenyl-diphosphate phosphatase [Acidobacterium]|uniref:Undecaprenyl-diphosphatase n=1 Tax=Acidobacterium capsulatum (strain ATCC 51196 / DSM 11244 / BCRC 80197 / JCM 7670 / NBRC 15755 / NCIMB 13165 / 161) TaxID=240015 RepID=C1F192_ACIC5|nr:MULTISPECIES: undecaprenyl-diphosphate phosphatase [Acidobacterium]ACO31649.1 putative undecaprenol kinase [Acidobacterium capsulatum ATCC 51196]HCT62422.1 undecaprenyl-diphosphate phosphatase [Acidobacterium sp.]